MQKRQIKVSALAMECLHVLEKYGYDKHTLWGNKYSEFFTIVRYYRDNNKEWFTSETWNKHAYRRYSGNNNCSGSRTCRVRID